MPKTVFKNILCGFHTLGKRTSLSPQHARPINYADVRRGTEGGEGFVSCQYDNRTNGPPRHDNDYITN